MKQFTKRLCAFFIILLLLGIYISGCASRAVDEEEGGISGTGNAVNCEDGKYRNQKLCK
jgi:hypothetical protein